jgi:hypothetical protein
MTKNLIPTINIFSITFMNSYFVLSLSTVAIGIDVLDATKA